MAPSFGPRRRGWGLAACLRDGHEAGTEVAWDSQALIAEQNVLWLSWGTWRKAAIMVAWKAVGETNVMTINMPPEIEDSILVAVRDGRFRSVGEAVAAAWRRLNRQQPESPPSPGEEADSDPDPIMGQWGDYADEMDAIVTDAHRQRRRPSWRELDVE